jgi:hypothetical protein
MASTSHGANPARPCRMNSMASTGGMVPPSITSAVWLKPACAASSCPRCCRSTTVRRSTCSESSRPRCTGRCRSAPHRHLEDDWGHRPGVTMCMGSPVVIGVPRDTVVENERARGHRNAVTRKCCGLMTWRPTRIPQPAIARRRIVTRRDVNAPGLHNDNRSGNRRGRRRQHDNTRRSLHDNGRRRLNDNGWRRRGDHHGR